MTYLIIFVLAFILILVSAIITLLKKDNGERNLAFFIFLCALDFCFFCAICTFFEEIDKEEKIIVSENYKRPEVEECRKFIDQFDYKIRRHGFIDFCECVEKANKRIEIEELKRGN